MALFYEKLKLVMMMMMMIIIIAVLSRKMDTELY